MIFKTERNHHEISFPPNCCAHISAVFMISVPLMVSAHFKGLTESQEVTLTGKEEKNLYFPWKGIPEK